MKAHRTLWISAVVAALALPLPTTGCGGADGNGSGKVANVKSGDMPQGADWTGVYFSELYGFLHVVAQGDTLQGKWIRPSKDRWGEMHGTATGDLVKFEWIEHTVGAIGPNSMKKGHGYFKYKRPEGENVDDTIAGEIGRGSDEVGDPWDAVKQRNVNPDLKSIGGTGTTDMGGGDWDKDSSQKGSPEAPQPPSL